MKRRALLHALAGGAGAIASAPARTIAPAVQRVVPGRALVFPRDHGAHPAFRTEWWYVTGWAHPLPQARAGAWHDAELGVQVTFFRSRTGHSLDNPSGFAPTQLVLAHAALALPSRGHLLHDERAWRAGLGLAHASEQDTDVAAGGWRFERDARDVYRARIEARGFALDLRFAPAGAPLLQGDGGYSRKGPRPEQASYYYSRPGMRISGSVSLDGAAAAEVGGVAWLDHEWSSALLDPGAQGWDWAGLNLDDGTAITAFRVRARDGSVLWTNAQAGGAIAFEPLRQWRSPRTGIRYPVAMRLRAQGRVLELVPLFDDQELDARASTGTIYWEGAVRVLEGGRAIGRGYLELTGYGDAMRI